MLWLTLITINLNQAAGLEKTLRSVEAQTCRDFEHLVIDGGSGDGSVDLLKRWEAPHRHWVSEADGGIYPAMNKGLVRARGRYVQFLNSGDALASPTVWESLEAAARKADFPPVLYGRMIKSMPSGLRLTSGDLGPLGLLTFYRGTLNHSAAFIRRDLFARYGLYDPALKVVADWKWFLQVLGLAGEEAVYVPVVVSLFDGGGISETCLDLRARERRQVLEALLPPGLLRDYDRLGFGMDQMERLQRHPWAYRGVWCLERCLRRWEKRSGQRRT